MKLVWNLDVAMADRCGFAGRKYNGSKRPKLWEEFLGQPWGLANPEDWHHEALSTVID
jgi:hypothetical protein